MNSSMMIKAQDCGSLDGALRRPRRPLPIPSLVPVLTRLLVLVVISGAVALLAALALATRPSIAAAGEGSDAERRARPDWAGAWACAPADGDRPACPARPGTTAKDL